VELQAAIEQHWKEVTATQWRYANQCTKPCEFEVSKKVKFSGINFKMKYPSKKLSHRLY
jgi:hypothetical protein